MGLSWGAPLAAQNIQVSCSTVYASSFKIGNQGVLHFYREARWSDPPGVKVCGAVQLSATAASALELAQWHIILKYSCVSLLGPDCYIRRSSSGRPWKPMPGVQAPMPVSLQNQLHSVFRSVLGTTHCRWRHGHDETFGSSVARLHAPNPMMHAIMSASGYAWLMSPSMRVLLLLLHLFQKAL